MKRIAELIDLKGRVAMVTGGGGHIGAALCAALAELGSVVVVVDCHEQNCHRVADQLRLEHDTTTWPMVADLSDSTQCKSLGRQVVDRFDRLDILVHCAAYVGDSQLSGWCTPYAEQSADVWRQAMEVNLTAPFVITQSCADALGRSGHGSVINVASIHGFLGPDMRLYAGTSMGNPAAYAASKGALIQHTRWLATVLAPRVRVNSISPGGIRRAQPEEFQRRYIERTPLARMGCEEDLKGAVAYLASDLSAYVTGHNLVVDGGWSSW